MESLVNRSIILQQPQGRPSELVLLFHGVGATPADMVLTGRRAGTALPGALVVSVAAPHPSDLGRGLHWFSVHGVTETSRSARVAEAMPAFVETVRAWQRQAELDATGTTLIGFSQGAIMSLSSSQLAEPPARRVIAIAGRFAQPAEPPKADVHLHLLHGEQDGVIPIRHSVDAAARLLTLGARVTLDTFAGLGHGIDERVLQRMSDRLQRRSPSDHEC